MDISSSLPSLLLAHCATVMDANMPLLVALFLGGLTGSVSHCIAMCSPFVLAQSETPTKPNTNQVMKRLLLPYHFGRLTTYTLLGIIAGASFQLLVNYAWFPVLSKLLLATAGCLFLLAFVQQLPLKLPRRLSLLPSCAMKQIHTLSAMQSNIKRYALGLMLGLIPCGLVFAALMAVAATGSALIGGAGMALFALGTMPALMMTGLAGTALMQRFSYVRRYAGAGAMAINSILLFSMVGGLHAN